MIRLARAGTLRGLAAVAIAAIVAGCSSTAAPSAPSQTVLAATPVATPAPATPAPATATVTPLASVPDTAAPSTLAPTAAPTSLDPCKLVTAQEASQLAGATYTTGKEDTTSANSKICWYGANTVNVFEVIVAQAPDAATLQTQKTEALTELQQKAGTIPIKTTMLSGVGDDAAFLTLSETISGQTVNGSGIYVVKGLVFFAIVDLVLGKAAPSSAAMQAEAQTVITRLP